MFDIEDIFNQFDAESTFVKAIELDSGHINDTFVIETNRKPFYVLQRINHFVFGDVPSLVENKIAVSSHLRNKLKHLEEEVLRERVLTFIRTKTNKNFYKDAQGNYWNLSFYVDNCVNYEKVPNGKIAFEAGKIFGEFLYLTNDFAVEKIVETIRDFHTMSLRFRQFDRALENAKPERIDQASRLIEFARFSRNEMLTLENLVNENKIPSRLTHNDTKISNVLFSQEGEALCVIDTDTVMKGIVHFDFGDAVRTICNNGLEDEKDLSKVTFNLEYFEAFTKGFSGSFGDGISDTEVEYLAFSAKVMTFIVGLRMLTDFLNNDVYFKPRYELHNLDRAKSQMKLVEEIGKSYEQMKQIVRGEYERNQSGTIGV